MELIILGLRWDDVGSDSLTWRDLKVIITQAREDGPLIRALFPDKALFVPRALEIMIHHLATGNVQRGNQSGAKREDFPKPPKWADDDRTSFGVDARPMEEIGAWLGGDFARMLDSAPVVDPDTGTKINP